MLKLSQSEYIITKYLSNFREAHNEAVFWLFRISYLWYSGIGCATTILVGLVVSFATGATDPAQVPIDLISPPIVKLLNSLPNKFKVP